MYSIRTLTALACATAALAQQSQITETFEKTNDDGTVSPAPIPGFDLQIDWSGVTVAPGDATANCQGVRPHGDYYGVIKAGTPMLMKAAFDVDSFDAISWAAGCANLVNGVYVPTDCTILVEGIAKDGTVHQDSFSYHPTAACISGATQNYADLKAYGFYQYNNLTDLTFTIQDNPGDYYAYVDDIAYTVTLSSSA